MKIDSFLLKHPFWFYVRSHPRAVALGLISLVVTNLLDGLYPLLLKEGLDLVEKKSDLSEISRVSMTFFALMVSLAFTRFLWRLGFGYFHSKAAEHLRTTLFNHLTKMSSHFFNKNPVGELMSLITNDVQSFRHAIGPGLLVVADGVIIIPVILPIMIHLNWDWTWKSLIFLPFVPFFIWKVMRTIHKKFKIQQGKFSTLTGFSQESLAGIRVIKSYALEDRRNEQFSKLSKNYEESCNDVALIDSVFGPIMEIGMASGAVILLFIAKDDLMSGAVSIGTFVAFHRYIGKMIWPMTALGLGLSMFQKGWASFDRIKEVLLKESDVEDLGKFELQHFDSLEFKNVSFQYPESNFKVLKDINFKLYRGETLGITGPVGAGKTTLMSLLLRLYPLKEGEILVNGMNINECTLESLRGIFLLIPQEAFLFSDTVENNLSFALSSKMEKDKSAALLELVDLKNEIENLPEKEQALLGEKGVNLSGGQKQRLTLARGMAAVSKVLILDDSLSAVDTKTEENIEKTLTQSKEQSRIIIAHRLSSLKGTHKILVLKDGQVEAFDHFEKLKSLSPTFANLVAMQSQQDSPR